MRKNILFLWCLLASSVSAVVAQIPTAPATALSPNAASLGEYGDVPISLFTGTPGIGVPLHTVVDGSISVPIELNYRASGVRPDEHPGWVGLNWTLNAGGVITRTVNDGPDEFHAPQLYCGTGNGYHYTGVNTFSLNGPGWNQQARLRDIARNYSCRDTEPDEFSFTFPGYSGKFYRTTESGDYGKWQVQCNKPVTVKLNVGAINGSSVTRVLSPIPVPWGSTPNTPDPNRGFWATFGGFTITTEDGTQYMFGHPGGTAQSALTAIEYSLDIRAQLQGNWIADAWHLTKITSPTGRHVRFTYEREEDYNGMFISNMYSSVTNMQSTGQNGGWLSYMSCSNSNGTLLSESYQGKLIAPVYLSSIQNDSSTVRFYRSTSIEKRVADGIYLNIPENQAACETCLGHRWPMLMVNDIDQDYTPQWDVRTCLARLKWKRLDSVQVQYRRQRRKSFVLTYNSPSITVANPLDEFRYPDRLMLLQVQEKGVLRAKPPYVFAYYVGNYKGVNYGSLPDYVANKNDHWGFYTNQFAFLHPSTYASYKSLRDPTSAPTVFLCGTLAKIRYPTGGWTEFEYEQHTYAKQVSQIRSDALQSFSSPQRAGGIRIKKIRNYVPNNPTPVLEKEYFYVENFSNTLTSAQLAQRSSGVLGGQIEYAFTDYTVPSHNGSNGSFRQNLFSSQPVLSNKNAHIGYTHVVEKRSDGSYTNYEFTNFDNGHLDESAGSGEILQTTRTAYEPYSSTEEERGKLLVEEIRNSSNQTVKRRTIAYVALNKSVEAYGFVRAVKANTLAVCAGTGVYYEEATAYKNYTYAYLPTTETETIYDANGQHPVTTTKTTVYNTYKLPAEITTTLGTKTLRTVIKYAPDFYNTHNYVSAKTLTEMYFRNMVQFPIEIIYYDMPDKIVGGTFYTYLFQPYNMTQPDNMLHNTPSNIQISKVRELEADKPLALTDYRHPYWEGVDHLDSLILDPKLKLKQSFTSYDYWGNVTGLVKRGNLLEGYCWGYGHTLPVMQVNNANRLPPQPYFIAIGNEASYLGFESGVASAGTDPNEDYWQMNASALSHMVSTPNTHTGEWAWRVGGKTGTNSTFGPTRAFSPDRQTQRYKLSAWVKTEAGFGTNNGRLVLSVNRADGTTQATAANCYASAPFGGSTDGKWHYVEVFLDLQAAHTTLLSLGVPTTERLQVVAYSYNDSPQPYLIDDIRFQPAESLMTTYTHKPLVGMTSQTDPSGRTTTYEYDEFGRLVRTRDEQGRILAQQRYQYGRP